MEKKLGKEQNYLLKNYSVICGAILVTIVKAVKLKG